MFKYLMIGAVVVFYLWSRRFRQESHSTKAGDEHLRPEGRIRQIVAKRISKERSALTKQNVLAPMPDMPGPSTYATAEVDDFLDALGYKVDPQAGPSFRG